MLTPIIYGCYGFLIFQISLTKRSKLFSNNSNQTSFHRALRFDSKTYSYNAITVYSCEQHVFRGQCSFYTPRRFGSRRGSRCGCRPAMTDSSFGNSLKLAL